MTTRMPQDDSVAPPDEDRGPGPLIGRVRRREEEGAPPSSAPDITRLGQALRDVEVRSVGITLLLVLAFLYTLYLARTFFMPIVIALLLNFLLNPIVRALARIYIPVPLGAGLVVLSLLGALGWGAYQLAEPAQAWVAKAPETFASVSTKLRKLRKPVEQVSRTAEQFESATRVDGPARAPEVVVRGPSLIARLFGGTRSFVAGLIEVTILLYFLLAAGDLFLQKLIKVLPQFRDKRKAVQIARETEASISTYLLTVAMVNAGEGILVTVAMWALGMPNPVLWGVAAAIVEFIPYFGATAMFAVLTLAGLTTFEELGRALLVPGSFLAINLVQAYLVSPHVLGRRLTLNPVAILVGLAFWWWMWGVPGAFIAVPLLAAFKIFCDHIDTLAPVGEFLGK